MARPVNGSPGGIYPHGKPSSLRVWRPAVAR